MRNESELEYLYSVLKEDVMEEALRWGGNLSSIYCSYDAMLDSLFYEGHIDERERRILLEKLRKDTAIVAFGMYLGGVADKKSVEPKMVAVEPELVVDKKSRWNTIEV